MNDPRTKRPSEEDRFDTRHTDWLKSLRSSAVYQEGKIVDLTQYTYGKTATLLTERELEVLQLASFGHSTGEIAKKLEISNHTVNNHRKNMIRSSKCGNITELVRVAIYENLL